MTTTEPTARRDLSTDKSEDAATTEVVHLDMQAHVARGRAARAEVPRSSHGEWSPAPNRVDVVTLLEQQEEPRVPELVPIRHQRMLTSPFAFYRGAAIVMAADLAAGPQSGLHVQAVGDAHLANFGGFASPERRMVFDINDFDETTPGPFEWDVKRLAASFHIAARSREFSDKVVRQTVLEVVRAYRESMAQFAQMNNLDVWYARLDVEDVIQKYSSLVTAGDIKRLQRSVSKAQSKDSLKAFDKLTTVVDGEHRIISDPPLVVPIRDLSGEAGATNDEVMGWLHEGFRVYRHSLQPDRRHLLEGYRIVDFARKVVGVGSVGTRCWIALLLGKDDGDPLFLQIKEAEASVLEPYAGRSAYPNHGQRVVEGQRLLQAAGDVMLGWLPVAGLDGVERDFYVRQLWDSKASALVDVMAAKTLAIYAELCGHTLARAHARSGDAVAIASYLGTADVFDRALASFAEAYADQNERDYDALKTAAAEGRIAVQEGL